MAIQTGVLTLKGKVGNIVGFKLPNAKVAGSMGARVYQSNVSNPKTEPQAIQRMKMTAAVNFYRQLTGILNNAWQGQKYGTKSRFYFMKLAMSQSTGLPFIVKGDKRFYPGEFPVSQGSLPTQSVTEITASVATTSINLGDFALASDSSWGDASQAIINNTFGLLDGDKITFIGVGVVSGEYAPVYSYIIVNTQSEQTVAEVMAGSKMACSVDNEGGLMLSILQLDSLVAGAVIVSRYPASNGGSWLRSNSTMFVRSDYRDLLMGTSAYQNALPSYMASADGMSSDWYLNKGLTGEGVDASWADGGSNLSYEFGTNVTVTISGTSVTIARLNMSDGTTRAAKSSYGFVAYRSGSVYKYKQGDAYLANATALQATGCDAWQVVTAELDTEDPIENRP